MGCLPSCSDKDNGMEQTEPNDPDDPQGPQIPDDPNPPMTGYIAHTMTEGELMYYGHDSEYSKEGGAVYFLYLKDLNNSARGCSVYFYVNVPRQEKGSCGVQLERISPRRLFCHSAMSLRSAGTQTPAGPCAACQTNERAAFPSRRKVAPWYSSCQEKGGLTGNSGESSGSANFRRQ